jgi:type II secretory pathway pseudopilin PulG
MGLMEKKAVRVTMPTSIVGNRRNSQAGFTYVMILVAVVVMGIFAEVASFSVSRSRQMDREAELLFRGNAYRNAIMSYYESGRPNKTYPRSLDDLVKDPRTAHKSHLRMLYPDPFGKEKAGWKLLRAGDGGISGVASQSTDKPLKTGNFRSGYEKFETATTYADWPFEYVLASSAVLIQ